MANKNNATRNVVAISAGVAAVAAASYYLFGPKGAQHRKAVRGWVIQMKGDVIRELETLKEVSEPIYNQIVETVAKKYLQQGAIAKADVAALATELKSHWKAISGARKTAAKKVAAKKAAPNKKPAGRKLATKATPKKK